jgi:cellulose synthase/poly-beta-1,6-N-acetylglucosamine synthase-like glycosyltransferase
VSNQPFVTVILPIRNEARHIGRCLEAVLSQDYAKERMQVRVGDAMSTDHMCVTVGALAGREARR